MAGEDVVDQVLDLGEIVLGVVVGLIDGDVGIAAIFEVK